MSDPVFTTPRSDYDLAMETLGLTLAEGKERRARNSDYNWS
jgi:hypothetical protein